MGGPRKHGRCFVQEVHVDENLFFEKILLNLGEWTPLIVVFWIIVWRVWPNVYELLKLYLETRAAMPVEPDAAQQVVDGLLEKVGTPHQFVFYVVDDASARDSSRALIGDVGAMVQSTRDMLNDARAQMVDGKQPPVSPTAVPPKRPGTPAPETLPG